MIQKNKNTNKSSSYNKEDSFLFSTSLIFDENIDELWLYLKDLSTETKNIEFLDNFKMIKGENTWTIGNVFSLYWVGVSNIEITCISLNVTRMKKKIKWKFICDIGISYYKTMILYRITSDDKTLVKLIFSRCEKNKLVDFNPQLQYYLNLQLDILVLQSKYLQGLKKKKKVYQSCIINNNYLKVWNYIANLKNIAKIFPELLPNIEYNGPFNEIGTFIKFYHLNSKKTIFLKLTEFSSQCNKKAYKCRYETIGTEIINFPQVIEIQITIITPDKTYISGFYIFDHNSKDKDINIFELNLKNLINKISNYIKENNEEFQDI